jgi:hypothetical protein
LTELESTVELIKNSSIGIDNFPSKAKLAVYIAGIVEGLNTKTNSTYTVIQKKDI